MTRHPLLSCRGALTNLRRVYHRQHLSSSQLCRAVHRSKAPSPSQTHAIHIPAAMAPHPGTGQRGRVPSRPSIFRTVGCSASSTRFQLPSAHHTGLEPRSSAVELSISRASCRNNRRIHASAVWFCQPDSECKISDVIATCLMRHSIQECTREFSSPPNRRAPHSLVLV